MHFKYLNCISLNKLELRKIYTQKRLVLTEAECLHLSRLICERFFSAVDLSFINVVHIFLPIVDKREVNTWLIFERIRREFPHIRLVVPKITSKGLIENYFFEGLQQLEKNKWGIDEPKYGELVEPAAIDLVVVPLLCFDKEGNRVGYGKGYYDKFLAKCKTGCTKIGLSYFEPIQTILNVNELDVRLDLVISPKQLFMF